MISAYEYLSLTAPPIQSCHSSPSDPYPFTLHNKIYYPTTANTTAAQAENQKMRVALLSPN
jgi:hypothetical protein